MSVVTGGAVLTAQSFANNIVYGNSVSGTGKNKWTGPMATGAILRSD
jgi:hypothetical protein